jgi:hypothetical protein
MANMNDAKQVHRYYMFKGEPGTRKSTAALSFPTPQYWFSWDQKMEAMRLPLKNYGMKAEDIQYDDYKDWNSARVKLESLQLNCPFKTLVIDSVTSCANYVLRQTKLAKTGVTRGSGKGQSNVSGIAINELEDYNAESAALLELVALTKDIHKFHKVNIILIAHIIQAEYKSPGGVTHMSRTIVTAGKRIAPQIPAYCSEVYHFNVDKSLIEGQGGDYSILTTHTGDDFARTGLPIEPKILFKDEPLYGRYIKPAIDKLNENPPEAITLVK